MNAVRVDAGRRGDVLERAVAVVAEQLLGAVLVADEQIEPAVVVEVGPRGRLRAVRPLDRPLVAVTSVNVPSPLLRSSELRIGNSQPPRMHEQVDAAVVVVVGRRDVEPPS